MDNYDKLYKQYQQASKNSEEKEFPAMDKVWTRLEDKLDAKVHKKQSKTWKKLAIAASVLLLVSLGYQLYKPTEINHPQNQTVETQKDAPEMPSPQIIPEQEIVPREAVAVSRQSNPVIRNDADAILKKQLEQQEPVGYRGKTEVTAVKGIVTVTDSIRFQKSAKDELEKSPAMKEKSNSAFSTTVFEAKSVQKETDDNSVAGFMPEAHSGKKFQKRPDPLVVMDGEAVKSGLKNLDPDAIESIVLLPEPLYVINGTEYSEDSLFGKNPTSPYAPLDKQEIKSVDVLQPDEAIQHYGAKGAKGIVIITTKNGQPAPKK